MRRQRKVKYELIRGNNAGGVNPLHDFVFNIRLEALCGLIYEIAQHRPTLQGQRQLQTLDYPADKS